MLIILFVVTLLFATAILTSCKDKNKGDDKDLSDVEFNTFTVGYLSEELYNDGVFDDAAISDSIAFDDENNGYMIIDFSYTLIRDIGNRHSLYLETLFPGRGVLDITIADAPTSGITETESTNGTTLSTKFTMPTTAGDKKSVRVVLRLMPLSGGDVTFMLTLKTESGIKQSGNSSISHTLNTGNPRLIFEINPDGNSYSVVGASSEMITAIIPERLKDGHPVTSIAANAFTNCKKLISVTVPKSVTSISKGAFEDCNTLKELTLPFIGAASNASANSHFGYIFGASGYYENGAFVPDSLEAVTITDGTTIGERVFSGCSHLKSITLPKSITTVHAAAFSQCTSLQSMTLPCVEIIRNGSATTYFGYIFDDSLSGITPASLTKVILTSGAEIPAGMFSGCSAITNIILPETVTVIGERAFYGCVGLTSMTIPKNVTEIGNNTFGECYKLIEIINRSQLDITADSPVFGNNTYVKEIHSGSTKIKSIDGFCFYTAEGTNYLLGYAGYDTVLVLPQQYNGEAYELYPYTFHCQEDITSISIPNGVTAIGICAFQNCKGLTDIIIPDSVKTIGNAVFSGCTGLKSATLPKTLQTIPSSLFSSCKSITSVTIPETVTAIGSSSFEDCSSLWSIVIPDNVTAIGRSAFSNCIGLTAVTLGRSVNTIESNAFTNCHKLIAVTNLSNLTLRAGDSVNGNVSYYAKLISAANSPIVNKDDYLFVTYDNVHYLMGYIGNSKNITLPQGYEGSEYEIYTYAFRNRNDITSAIVPTTVKKIGYAAFACTSLTHITIPFVGAERNAETASATTLFGYIFGEEALTGTLETRQEFSDNVYKTYWIPASLVSVAVTGGDILRGAFQNCQSIVSVTIGRDVTSIAYRAFNACPKLVEIINLSSLKIKAGSSDYGAIAANAKLVHSEGTKIANENGYLFYTFNDINYLVGYVGTDKELILPQSYKNADYKIDDYAFYMRADLKSITMISGITAIGTSAFRNCLSLSRITLSNGMTSIAAGAFYGCSALKSITIPDGVTAIGGSAFWGCNLKSVTLPKSLTKIDDNAFRESTQLKDIYYEGNEAEWNRIEIGEFNFVFSSPTIHYNYVAE